MITKEQIAEQYQQIQNEICAGLELADGKGKFQEEIWNRDSWGFEEFLDDKGILLKPCSYSLVPEYTNHFLTAKAGEEHLI